MTRIKYNYAGFERSKRVCVFSRGFRIFLYFLKHVKQIKKRRGRVRGTNANFKDDHFGVIDLLGKVESSF